MARFDRTDAILVCNGERNLRNDYQEGSYSGCIVCVGGGGEGRGEKV